jgi:hypothetical protein
MERIDNEVIDLGVASRETKGPPLPAHVDSFGSIPNTGLTDD